MKIADLRNKTPDELRAQLVEVKKELFNLRFQQAAGELQNTALFSQLRRNVARVKMLLSEKAA